MRMHESGTVSWRDVLDTHHSRLVDDLSASIDSGLRDAVGKAIAAERSRRTSQVESLNQVLRRLRLVAEDRVLPLLAEGCASYAEKLVVLVFENNQARSVASSGVGAADLGFDTVLAPAIVSAIDSGELIVALANNSEISPVLAQALGGGEESAENHKAYLFPVVARHTVMALLVATGEVVSAQIELLCQAAGMRLEAVTRTWQASEGVPPGCRNRLLGGAQSRGSHAASPGAAYGQASCGRDAAIRNEPVNSGKKKKRIALGAAVPDRSMAQARNRDPEREQRARRCACAIRRLVADLAAERRFHQRASRDQAGGEGA